MHNVCRHIICTWSCVNILYNQPVGCAYFAPIFPLELWSSGQKRLTGLVSFPQPTPLHPSWLPKARWHFTFSEAVLGRIGYHFAPEFSHFTWLNGRSIRATKRINLYLGILQNLSQIIVSLCPWGSHLNFDHNVLKYMYIGEIEFPCLFF